MSIYCCKDRKNSRNKTNICSNFVFRIRFTTFPTSAFSLPRFRSPLPLSSASLRFLSLRQTRPLRPRSWLLRVPQLLLPQCLWLRELRYHHRPFLHHLKGQHILSAHHPWRQDCLLGYSFRRKQLGN